MGRQQNSKQQGRAHQQQQQQTDGYLNRGFEVLLVASEK
jgi:hypothetical protein